MKTIIILICSILSLQFIDESVKITDELDSNISKKENLIYNLSSQDQPISNEAIKEYNFNFCIHFLLAYKIFTNYSFIASTPFIQIKSTEYYLDFVKEDLVFKYHNLRI